VPVIGSSMWTGHRGGGRAVAVVELPGALGEVVVHEDPMPKSDPVDGGV